MKHLRSKYQLMMAESQVEKIVAKVEQERLALTVEKKRFGEQYQTLQNIINQNKAVVRMGELCLFSIKESVAGMVRDYEKVADIVHGCLNQQQDLDKMRGILIGLEAKINSMQDSFAAQFGMTTDQYIESTKRIQKLN